MTVTYHAGRRIQATSTDFAGIPAISGGWKELGRTTLGTPTGSATFTSDFSSATGWTATGSTPAVNTGTEKIDFESATSANIKAQLTYDLTSTSDTKWVLRCKLNVTTFTQPTTEYHRFFIGLSSSTSNLNTSEDAIGLKYELGAGSLDRLVAIDTNGSAIRATTGDNFTHTSAVETLYVEIIRQSATTYDVNLRTGSHNGTLVEGKTGLTVSASTTGLRYLKIGSYSDNAGNGELSGTINNIQFWNDQTIGISDNITVSSLDDKRYYMVLADLKASGYILNNTRLNSDTGSNYAWRRALNGASDSTSVSQTFISQSDTGAQIGDFGVEYITNLSSKEKLTTSHVNENPATGAGTAPSRIETVGKWANTSSAVSAITKFNSHSGNYDTGSECVVLGYDPDDTHTDNFWEELASVELGSSNAVIDSGTITAKKYLWVQVYSKGQSANSDFRLKFNNDNSNYSWRWKEDGGSELTSTSETRGALIGAQGISTPAFANVFIINNSANEKLVISHSCEQSTAGAGNAPRRAEAVSKWANTSDSITNIKCTLAGSTTFNSGSIIKVWGSN